MLSCAHVSLKRCNGLSGQFPFFNFLGFLLLAPVFLYFFSKFSLNFPRGA